MIVARSQNNQILRKPWGKLKQFKRKRTSPDPSNREDLWISWRQMVPFPVSYSVWLFPKSWFWSYFKGSKRRKKLENIIHFLLIHCFKKKTNRTVLMHQVFSYSMLLPRASLFPKVEQSSFQFASYRASTQGESSIFFLTSRQQKLCRRIWFICTQ